MFHENTFSSHTTLASLQTSMILFQFRVPCLQQLSTSGVAADADGGHASSNPRASPAFSQKRARRRISATLASTDFRISCISRMKL